MSNLSEKQRKWEMYANKMNAIARSMNQGYAKQISEISILPKSKLVVQAVRYRRNEDTMMSLKAQKLSAAYLRLWSDTYRDNELVHLVFEQQQLRALKRIKDTEVRQIYIQAGEKEWRVMIESITAHPSRLEMTASPWMDRQCGIQRVRAWKAKQSKSAAEVQTGPVLSGEC